MQRIETLEDVNREGQERFCPSLTNPSWLVLSKRREIFRKWFSQLARKDLWVLDVGGRIQPYRRLLEECLCRYIAIDLRRTPLVTALARGEQIPFPGSQFDLVICTQVLEYLRDPELLVGDVHRVLKPGGCFVLSVPSASPRDADEECWRFFPAALRHLLSCFETVEIVPEGTSITGFFRTINICLDIFVRYRQLRFLYRHTVCPVVNLTGALLERIAGSHNDQFAANYSVLARKSR